MSQPNRHPCDDSDPGPWCDCGACCSNCHEQYCLDEEPPPLDMEQLQETARERPNSFLAFLLNGPDKS